MSSSRASAPPSPLAAWSTLVTIYLVWGSTYLAIAVVVQTLPPLLSAGVRFLVAGALVLAWTVLRGSFRREPPTLRQWGAAAIIGGALLLGGNGLVMLAEQIIPSGVTALLVGTVPIWMAVIDGVVNRQGLSRLVVFGLLAGFAGVAILAFPGTDPGAINPIGAGMLLVATLSWAAGSIYARGASLPKAQLVSTGMEMLAGGALLALAGVAIGEPWRLDASGVSTQSLLALGYLIVVGSLVGFTVYIWLLNHLPTSTVATYAYVNPIVAVALGWAILSEPITLRTVIAAVVIIGAVAAMVRGRPHAPPETATAPEEEPAAEPDLVSRPAEPTLPTPAAGGAVRRPDTARD